MRLSMHTNCLLEANSNFKTPFKVFHAFDFSCDDEEHFSICKSEDDFTFKFHFRSGNVEEEERVSVTVETV